MTVRLKSKVTGVIVNVSEGTAAHLSSEWVEVRSGGEPEPTAAPVKKTTAPKKTGTSARKTSKN